MLLWDKDWRKGGRGETATNFDAAWEREDMSCGAIKAMPCMYSILVLLCDATVVGAHTLPLQNIVFF